MYAVQVWIPASELSSGFWRQITPDDLSSDGGLAKAAYAKACNDYTEVRLIHFETSAHKITAGNDCH